jgi:serine carboxypeptidase-like clade 2
MVQVLCALCIVQAANMIYLEAPAGVGFSYASNGNYTTGDNATALDNYNFLAGFIQQYPEYAQRPFYVSGESYGGHYVPQLASLLAAKPIPGINLKGFFVGNPSFDGFYDSNNYWTFSE